MTIIDTHQRVKDLRIEKGLTQQDMADLLKIPRGNYSRYENGLLEFNNDMLRTLSKYFDVSSDYLLCLKDEYN